MITKKVVFFVYMNLLCINLYAMSGIEARPACVIKKKREQYYNSRTF